MTRGPGGLRGRSGATPSSVSTGLGVRSSTAVWGLGASAAVNGMSPCHPTSPGTPRHPRPATLGGQSRRTRGAVLDRRDGPSPGLGGQTAIPEGPGPRLGPEGPGGTDPAPAAGIPRCARRDGPALGVPGRQTQVQSRGSRFGVRTDCLLDASPRPPVSQDKHVPSSRGAYRRRHMAPGDRGIPRHRPFFPDPHAVPGCPRTRGAGCHRVQTSPRPAGETLEAGLCRKENRDQSLLRGPAVGRVLGALLWGLALCPPPHTLVGPVRGVWLSR